MKEIKRLSRCEKGHFYDAGKFDSCPHCRNTSEISVTRCEPAWREPEDVYSSSMMAFVSGTAGNEDYSEETRQDFRGRQLSAADRAALENIAPDEDRTVQYYQKTLGTEPVVGWMVCVGGVHCGQDFRIKSGRNFVGRSGAMDVCLSGDMAVSRDRHLVVTYDPKSDAFFAQPGDTSSALSYLNDAPLLEATPLKTGDKLTVGETDLIFVAFCGTVYSWKK